MAGIFKKNIPVSIAFQCAADDLINILISVVIQIRKRYGMSLL